MNNKFDFVEEVLTLSVESPLGLRKQINVVTADGQFFYCLGTFDIDHVLRKDGIFFSEKEFKIFIHGITQIKDKDLELDKFKRDYLQQIHNGLQVEKEKDLI